MIVSLLKINHSTNKIEQQHFNLSQFNFLTRNSIKELIRHFALEISKAINDVNFQEFKQNFDNKKTVWFYVKIIKGYLYMIVTENEYPRMIAYMLIKDMEENKKNYKELQEEYEDVESKDLLTCVNKQLDETKIVLTRTLEDVVGRGEKLDDLVSKSDNLSTQTKALFNMSKKQNRCGC
ncbi:palmitoyltransferase [Binucleata daphniae]